MTLSDKARAEGLDERTIQLAYADFVPGHDMHNAAVQEAHLRVCIYALCHDNPIGNVRFQQFGAGIVRTSDLGRDEHSEG
jgi:hypothetical protein